MLHISEYNSIGNPHKVRFTVFVTDYVGLPFHLCAAVVLALKVCQGIIPSSPGWLGGRKLRVFGASRLGDSCFICLFQLSSALYKCYHFLYAP
jgi:hypothetical protein